jgi:hypothetical protein
MLMLLCDIPALGLIGPRRLKDRLLVLSFILTSFAIPLAVLYTLRKLEGMLDFYVD